MEMTTQARRENLFAFLLKDAWAFFMCVSIASALGYAWGYHSYVPRIPSTPPGMTETEATSAYCVAPGDTLYSIAARTLGSGGRWREIAAINEIPDPGRLAVGQKLRLPPR